MPESEIVVPAELPEKPTGWTTRSVLHLNFGGGKGAASYTIHDEQGRRVEGLGYSYNTREGVRGFTLRGEGHYTWAELRQAYGVRSETTT